jgi:hypothetical protein
LPTSRTNAWLLGNSGPQFMSFSVSQKRFGKADQRAIMYRIVFTRRAWLSESQWIPVLSVP